MTGRAARFVLPVLVLMAVMAPTSSAATKEKTVKGDVVFAHGQRPGDPGDCSAIVFVKWADVPGTVSARAIYTFNGSERSESLPAPFNDTFKFVADYQVPAGYHWIAVGRSWANGPVANTCEETSEKQKQIIGTEASVELTVEIDPAVCNAAKAKLAARKKAVSQLSSQLRKATSQKAKKALRSKIAKAKTKRAAAAKRVHDVC
jgi:hypothetical protein